MDLYDEMYEIKNGREIDDSPPPDLDVSGSLQFINQEDEDEDEEEEEDDDHEDHRSEERPLRKVSTGWECAKAQQKDEVIPFLLTRPVGKLQRKSSNEFARGSTESGPYRCRLVAV